MTSTHETFFLGADGGGSGCRIALARVAGSGGFEVLADARGASANVTSDFDGAIAALGGTILDAARSAGVDIATVRAHCGLAGVLDTGIAARVADALPIRNVTVSDDRETSVVGALGGENGTVISIGTGSFIGRSVDGVQTFIGGWGFRLGDQASGAWLSRALLIDALLCHDKMLPPSGLLTDVLTEFSNRPQDVVAFGQTARPGDIAAYAPRIVDAAKAGDAAAQNLMQRGAGYVTRALGALGTGGAEPICVVGGLGPAFAPYLPAERAAQITDAKGNALDGALRLAAAGGKV
ncbi:BadF/BadG/BcrA/BcrD ATPase family protein [Aliiroseovarius sp. YM-037]|uniref:BadF/BadG/BcrA/BcrD ATPase family protein n=1 Tax=Aliiroseovarius sp. YM-037 TaxID=3341728 RepID=UPI003A802455